MKCERCGKEVDELWRGLCKDCVIDVYAREMY